MSFDVPLYFCGSIRGGQSDVAIYYELIAKMKEFGKVLTEHVGDMEYIKNEQATDSEIWETDMGWLRQSKAVIAEVTVPSLGVGYELGIAEALHLPVLALHRLEPSRISAMVSGNPHFQTEFYSDVSEAKLKIESFLIGLGIQKKECE